jgi:Tfp pilus assembly protein PilF
MKRAHGYLSLGYSTSIDLPASIAIPDDAPMPHACSGSLRRGLFPLPRFSATVRGTVDALIRRGIPAKAAATPCLGHVRAWLICLLVISLAACAPQLRQPAVHRPPTAPLDQPVGISSPIAAAYLAMLLELPTAQARATYPDARRRFLAGLPQGHRLLVTTSLREAAGEEERVFVAVDRIEGGRITGRLANEILLLRSFHRGQTYTFPEDALVDWTIVRPDGTEEGNFVGKFLDAYQQRVASPAEDPEGGIPQDLREAVLRAETLGRAIFEVLTVTARATAALLAAGVAPGDPRIKAAVAMPARPGWVVYFVGEQGAEFVALYEVTFARDSASQPEVKSWEPPKSLGPEATVRVRARQTAILKPLPMCASQYSAVVLPGALVGEPGWLVYLMAGPSHPGEIVVGGHYRIDVTADGAQVHQMTPLWRECLTLALPPEIKSGSYRPFRFVASHVVTAWPMETHVFLNLLHGVPMIVTTSRGEWRVDRGRVHFLRAREPSPGERGELRTADYREQGLSYVRQGQDDAAIEAFKKAVQVNPNDYVAYKHLGERYGEKGLVDEAMVAFQRALAINPNDGHVYANLGRLYDSRGQLAEALSQFDHALQLDPGSAYTHNLRCLTLRKMGKVPEAVEACNNAIAAEPGYKYLGLLYSQLGKPEVAILAFKKVLEIDPKFVAAHEQLADLYQRQGNTAEAKKHFNILEGLRKR